MPLHSHWATHLAKSPDPSQGSSHTGNQGGADGQVVLSDTHSALGLLSARQSLVATPLPQPL